LRHEPVEDFRIDFEDGYGNRPDEEEDAHAVTAAAEVAEGGRNGTLPPFIGIRIKPFNEELRARSFRTLEIFVLTLAELCVGQLPDNFVITLPKITIPEQVSALVALLGRLEEANGLAKGTLKFEMMIETTQAIINHQGQINLPLLLAAAKGRCVAAHFGTYDYTAGCNITAAHQHMLHPACDFAKNMMQVSFAGTGIWLSDGATNIMPVAPNRFVEGGPPLTQAQIEENRAVVHRAWKLHYDSIR
jgi:citrate lyase beta subunit